MESVLAEKVKEMRYEELVRFLERGGIYALIAAEEGLRRFELGEEQIGEKFFILVLESKITKSSQAKEIKKVSAKILEERFFSEKSVIAILNCEELERGKRKKVAKRYLNLGGKDKEVLKQILSSNFITQEIKNLAGEKLLSQRLKNDELLLIAQETTDQTQMKALRKFLRKSKDLEDRIILIEHTPAVAEIVWEETLSMIRKKEPRERAEILFDILKYTDSENVKKKAANEIWMVREVLKYEELEYLNENADSITIENPEKVRKWIDENILKIPKFEERGYEKIKKVAERALYPEIQKRAIERAIQEAQREIIEIESSKHQSSWEIERVNFLKKEIENLRKKLEEMEESIDQGIPLLA